MAFPLRRTTSATLAIFTGLLLAGCASKTAVMNCDLLSQETKEFGKLLRWRESTDALKRVKAAPEGPRTVWDESLKPLEIVDCSVKELVCKTDSDQAQSVFSLSYLRSGSAVLRNAELPVEWHYQQSGSWQIISSPPKLP
jgi:hypothetical protein